MIFESQKNQSLINYIGNYDYYLEKKDVMESLQGGEKKKEEAKEAVSEVKLDWKSQKEEQARKRKLQNELKKTEEEISSLEARDGELDEQLTLEEVYTDHQRVREINDEKTSIAGRLEELYARWEELAEEA